MPGPNKPSVPQPDLLQQPHQDDVSDPGYAHMSSRCRSDAVPPQRPTLPQLYSVEDVCMIFDRSPRTIRAWCRSGHLSPVRVGKAVFFKSEDIDAILNCSSSIKPNASE